jgi:hypothetical protein
MNYGQSRKIAGKMGVIVALFLIALVTVPASGAGPEDAVRVYPDK